MNHIIYENYRGREKRRKKQLTNATNRKKLQIYRYWSYYFNNHINGE